MFCKNCGCMIQNDDKLCVNCGQSFESCDYCGGFWDLLGEKKEEQIPEIKYVNVTKKNYKNIYLVVAIAICLIFQMIYIGHVNKKIINQKTQYVDLKNEYEDINNFFYEINNTKRYMECLSGESNIEYFNIRTECLDKLKQKYQQINFHY